MREWEKSFFFAEQSEKPLDRLAENGGLCSIFRKIAFVGDSLSSGEFESTNEDGTIGYHDLFAYSFGQYMARLCGFTAYNFSCGGLTAKAYHDFAESKGLWAPELAAQAYVVALGVNDLFGKNKLPVGTVADIDSEDPGKNNRDTFAGNYAAIIQRYQIIQPGAKFFLVTMPRPWEKEEMYQKTETDQKRYALEEAHAALLYQMAEIFPRTYVIDLRRYGPVYDEAFKKRFYMGTHMNPAGYYLTARMIASYIDYIIRKNPEDFKQVGFIGTDLRNARVPY